MKKAAKDIDRETRNRFMRRIGEYALKHKGAILLGVAAMALHALCRQFPIWATGQLIDKVISLDVNKIRESQTKQVKALRIYVDIYADGGSLAEEQVRNIRAKRQETLQAGDFKRAVLVLTEDERKIDALHAEIDRILSSTPPDRSEVKARLAALDKAEPVGAKMSPDRMRWLKWICLAIILVAAVGALMHFVNEYFFKWLATKVVVDLRAELMRHLMRLPLTFFHRRKMGDVHSRLTNDVQSTFQSVNLFWSELVMEPITIIATIGTAVTASWRLSIFIFVLVPIVIFPVARFGKRVKKTARKGFESLGDTTEVMMQSISGIRIVKAFRGQDAEYKRFVEKNDEYLRRNLSLVKTKAISRGLMDFLYSAALGVFLFVGGYLLVNDLWDITAGSLVTFITAVGMIYRPIRRLAHAYGNFQESLAASGRIFELLDAEPERIEDGSRTRIRKIESEISLVNVGFSYGPELGSVLDDVNLTIKRGETVALVGRSGSGKSTIADLIARFYAPVKGHIFVDGAELESIDRESYLDRIAIVSQHPFLFNTTVRENILYGRPDATEADVIAAAKAANIHDVIAALPRGYDTVVGERGATLSGGELQRVTIARAILRNADLLILDEATSSLDAHSERVVQEALDHLVEGRTALVIAHRLSTVKKADKIVVLDSGHVRETGTHDELLKRNGLYAALVASQQGGTGSTDTGNYPLFQS